MVTATAAQHWKASRQLLHLMYLPVQVGSLVIPLDKRPGPFGRNCISARQVLAKRMVGIHIRSDDGMGFPSTTVPLTLSSQQRDVTNTNGSITLVEMHNEAAGERQYWKLKGKKPTPIYLSTGSNGL
jgi:hypothetical protein